VPSNTLLTPTIIANELLMRFKNNLGFAKTVAHDYDGKFDKIGDTYNLREPVRFTTGTTADITSAIQDVTESSIPLTITTQRVAAFQFTSKDLTLTVDRFADRYLNSAAVALANAFEVDGLSKAYQNTANLVGTPGTTPATAKVILDAGAMLDNNACPVDGDRYLCVNPSTQASMVDTLKGLFQSSNDIAQQYRKGRMGEGLGFDWGMSQNIRVHTNGTQGGSPLFAGAQTGSSIATDGWTPGATIKAGTVFTLQTTGSAAKVYAVNPVSGDTLDYQQQFVVTADVTATDGTATLSISPAIVTTGAKKNVSVAPGDNAVITIVGSASTGYAQNLAYHKKAFQFAMVPLEVPQGVHFAKTATDPDAGLSIRMVSAYNVLTDVFVTRCDVMYGWAAARSAWACRITS
jgi:P22 coat protein - gene protein 5